MQGKSSSLLDLSAITKATIHNKDKNIAKSALVISLVVYALLNLAMISEQFMMPALMQISLKYSLSKDLTGMTVALGNSVPELATTVLSFMGGSISMAELGLASNIGTAMFVITVAPAIGIYFNQDTAFSIETEQSKQVARMGPKIKDKIHKDHWN